jgi:hypothetical protein
MTDDSFTPIRWMNSNIQIHKQILWDWMFRRGPRKLTTPHSDGQCERTILLNGIIQQRTTV